MSESVRAYETTLSLPGYLPDHPQKVPLFQTTGHTRIYPYPLRDHLNFKKEKLTCRALVVENEFLKMTVLPRFGGHMWSLYDKRRKREVFYTPDIVKPGLIHLPGAWMPVGIEFNFPNGHTPMSMHPVSAELNTQADGSAGVVVGDTEFMSRMRWQVRLSLRPGVAALDVETRLSNPTPLTHRWYFWANAAVDVSKAWEFCLPGKYGRVPWTGQKMDYPIHEGRHMGRYDAYRGPGEFFGAGVAEDFFGCYNEDSGAGIVHVADHKKMVGKKFFTWGSGPEGLAWGRVFCDKPVRHYVEIQCGPLETQMDRAFFPPHGERAWSERWYPVDRTGPFFYATDELAVGMHGDGKRRKLTIFPCVDGGPVTLKLTRGKTIVKKKAALKAGQRIALPCPDDGQKARLEIVDAAGKRLLRVSHPYAPKVERGLIERLAKMERFAKSFWNPKTPRQKLARIEKLLVEGREELAMEWLDESLAALPKHAEGRLWRGLIFLKRGRWGRAEVDFRAATRSRKHAAEAHYRLGLTERYRGQPGAAREAFQRASVIYPKGSEGWARAEHELASLDIAEGKHERARSRLTQLCNEPAHATAERRTLLALTRRLGGDYWGAQGTLDAVLRDDPLFLPARWERWAVGHEGKRVPMKEQVEEIRKLHEHGMHPAADRQMEVAWWYTRLGQYKLALTALGERELTDPRAEYLSAYIQHLYGHMPKKWIDRHLNRAARRKADYAFPFRLEEIALFDWVTKVRPKDAQAWRLRGTLLGSFHRYSEALSDFQRATKLAPKDPLAWRNLAIAQWKLKKPAQTMATNLEKARTLSPKDSDIACELLSTYDRMGATQKRLALIDQVPPAVRSEHRFRKRIVGVLAEAGRYADVVKLIDRYPFVAWEGEINAQTMFAFCCLQLCRENLDTRRFAQARRWAERAGTYPPTTFAARPSRPTDAEWRYWKGVALRAAGKERPALAEFRKAANEDDYSIRSWISTETPFWRALARLSVGRDAEAQADFEKTLKLTKRRDLFYGASSTFADYANALAYLGMGELRESIRCFETVLKSGGLRHRARPWIERLKAAQKKRNAFVWPHDRYGK